MGEPLRKEGVSPTSILGIVMLPLFDSLETPVVGFSSDPEWQIAELWICRTPAQCEVWWNPNKTHTLDIREMQSCQTLKNVVFSWWSSSILHPFFLVSFVYFFLGLKYYRPILWTKTKHNFCLITTNINKAGEVFFSCCETQIGFNVFFFYFVCLLFKKINLIYGFRKIFRATEH